MFVDEVEGHDHQSREFIVKFWLINDVSHSNTCSHNEISTLSILFLIFPISESLTVTRYVHLAVSCEKHVCVCVNVWQSKCEEVCGIREGV